MRDNRRASPIGDDISFLLWTLAPCPCTAADAELEETTAVFVYAFDRDDGDVLWSLDEGELGFLVSRPPPTPPTLPIYAECVCSIDARVMFGPWSQAHCGVRDDRCVLAMIGVSEGSELER